MNALLPAISGIFLPILLGLISRRTHFINPEHRPHILQFAVRVCIPFMVFESMRNIDTGTAGQFIPMTAGLFLFTALSWLTMYILIRVLIPYSNWVRQYKAELLIMAFIGNIGYICWKIQEIVAGTEALQRGIFYTSFYWPALIVFSLITLVVLKLTKAHSLDSKEILKNIIPLLAMLALGLTAGLLHLNLPEWLTAFTGSLGPIAVPTILFCTGLSISVKGTAKAAGPILPYLIVRQLIWIALFALILRLSWFDDISRKVLFINAFAPIGVTTMVICDMFGLDTDFAANAIALSTVIYLLMLPLLFLLW
ncbi:MAG: hypothetical protein PQJ58_07110 [Spirochaetales bacterium]|nr:hypothetical protein [Spirochaetales bacterium]